MIPAWPVIILGVGEQRVAGIENVEVRRPCARAFDQNDAGRDFKNLRARITPIMGGVEEARRRTLETDWESTSPEKGVEPVEPVQAAESPAAPAFSCEASCSWVAWRSAIRVRVC